MGGSDLEAFFAGEFDGGFGFGGLGFEFVAAFFYRGEDATDDVFEVGEDVGGVAVGTPAHFTAFFVSDGADFFGLGFGDAEDFVFGDHLVLLAFGGGDDVGGFFFGFGDDALGLFDGSLFNGGGFLFGSFEDAFGFFGEGGGVLHFARHGGADFFDVENQVVFFEAEGETSVIFGLFDVVFEDVEKAEDVGSVVFSDRHKRVTSPW